MVIVEVFTEALGREITFDDLIDKDDSAEKPESTQHLTTPPEPRSIEDKIDEIADMRQDMNQQMAGIRDEISK